MQKGKKKMAKLPKYFYFRLHSMKHGTEIEIEDASNVDVAEIVRCKDCMFYMAAVPSIGEEFDWCHAWGNNTTEDGFCHHAERINDD